MNLPAQIQTTLSHRHSRTVIVGVVLLAIVAVLQVIHAQNSQPLVPLISQSQLNDGDVERMQIAISKAGISGCVVENGQLMVPEHRLQACLTAVAEHNALPQFLRSETKEKTSINPFLSRSQRKQIADAEKKKHIREMIARLPFVKNAWFEMDTSSSGNAFAPARRTAVISVEPQDNNVLGSQQVATLREMVAGAVANISTEDIVVIDIDAGYAHRCGQSANVPESFSISQRPKFEQENFYRKRIQQAVAPYGDIDVQVRVDLVEVPQVQTAAYAQNIAAQPPQAPAKTNTQETSNAVIGTNGTASIYDQPEVVQAKPVVQATAMLPAEPKFTSRVNVLLDVPEKAALQFATSSAPSQPQASIKQQAIDRMGRQLVDTIRPILPPASFDKNASFPIAIKFVPTAAPVVVTWQDRLKSVVERHWPSAAVLIIGLMLLTMVSRNNEVPEDVEIESNEDILSIDSVRNSTATEAPENHFPEVALAQPEDYARREAEEKLGRIVERDPDSAARVIESWIRDAG
jgi:flagellar biosynthesis/type III secretory pathway M-ring protein FliF/YscJ